MLRLLRTLTPGLLALCHLGVAQAAAQTAPPDASANEINKAASSSSDETAAKKRWRSTQLAQVSNEKLPICDQAARLQILSVGSEEFECAVRNVYREIPQHLPLPADRASNAKGGLNKKEIGAETYDRWSHIVQPTFSGDGKWVAYILESSVGLGELVVRATGSKIEFRVPMGLIPRRMTRQDEVRPSRTLRISSDSGFALFTIAELRESNQGSPAHQLDGQPASPTLGVLRLQDGALMRLRAVSDFKSAGRRLAYQRKSVRETGVVLRDLVAHAAVEVPDAAEFVFDEQGRYLAYTVESDISERNGAFVRRLDGGKVFTLLRGPGKYRNITFDSSGDQLVFMAHSNDDRSGRFGLYYASAPFSATVAAVEAKEIDGSLMISANDAARFTRLGNAVTFTLVPSSADSSAPSIASAKANFELWHWRELQALPQGVKSHAGARVAVYHVGSRHWIQLGDRVTPSVLVADDARHAVGVFPHGLKSSWEGWKGDVYLIDAHSGRRRLHRRALKPELQMGPITCFPRIYECAYFSLSPGGKYVVYFEARRWWSVDLATGEQIDLTTGLPQSVRFDVSEATDKPAPYSQPQMLFVSPVAGWTQDDRRVLLYDTHDLWAVDPTGVAPPRSLTAGMGARENIVFRLLEHFGLALDGAGRASGAVESGFWSQPERFLDPASLLLMAVDRDTMSSGVWRTRANALPEQLLQVNKRVEPIARAAHSPQYLLTMQTYSEFPDLWNGSHFDGLRRISDANPQSRDYRWGTAELVEYTSDFGVRLKGLLYKPEGFDPGKRYPMVVSVYQNPSRQLHTYRAPAPLNTSPRDEPWPAATSRGYLHFQPDILTATPFPGSSAVAAVVPAVASMIEKGFVDPKRIALTGHSFGAYEAMFVLTQSSLFRCAVVDAGPTNMLSFYATRQPIFFERGGLLPHGGSVWERPFIYFLNSPVLHADRVRVPVLMMFNEKDPSAPLSEGIQFFNGLRRHETEAYLFNYHGEHHALAGYVNQLHWDQRVHEFLDHHLRSRPRSEWMQASGLN